MRVNHVLIDYENVKPAVAEALARLEHQLRLNGVLEVVGANVQYGSRGRGSFICGRHQFVGWSQVAHAG